MVRKDCLSYDWTIYEFKMNLLISDLQFNFPKIVNQIYKSKI